MDRKEFIQKSFRIGILAGITGSFLFLVKRNRVDFNCTKDEVCGSCSLYSGCDLDKAKESKTNEQ